MEIKIKTIPLTVHKRRKNNPTSVMCPACGVHGRYSEFHVRHDLQQLRYVVIHGKLLGTWGRKTQIARRRRCYINDPEQIAQLQTEFIKARDKQKFWRNYAKQEGV